MKHNESILQTIPPQSCKTVAEPSGKICVTIKIYCRKLFLTNKFWVKIKEKRQIKCKAKISAFALKF